MRPLKRNTGCAGFTLVELLISAALFSLVLAQLFVFLGCSLKSWDKTCAQAEKQQLCQAVLSRLSQDIHQASQVEPTSDASRLLLLVKQDLIEYSLSNGKVKRKKNMTTSYLTDNEEISNLSFSYPSQRLITVSLQKTVAQIALRDQP
ncbi:hypothetical protein COT42_00975 [Candidatus Saganbacteria bacterium CG08_land_8_20_14_0_20_45_16]|uniref:Prepilin-type N-terminal cleavage/methylation domain-containing protein n=1 Tax=Candidatus Saganbacteria bacterium CG08_land_8_20_14_0_20_45_16 TaxID=2014293 RepID=A0A2H0Y1H7_UNCSA|nr:MAG: hypothetical protein COT42_00975 [Candidatus Saganbacteria bacterium CG08_land_8_20_14_0_20_45_16]